MRALAFAIILALPATAAEIRLRPGDAFDAAAARLKAGDTLVVEAGVYTNGWTVNGLKGTAEAPIVIRGEAGAVLQPVHEREGIVFWGEPSEHVTIEGLTVYGARRAGVIVSGSRQVTIRGCTILSNGVWGVQTSLSESILIEDCDIGGSQAEHGIYFSTTDAPVVRNSRIFDNASCGIHMNGDKSEGGDGMISGALIEDCRIYGNGSKGGAAVNMDGVERSTLRRNLLYKNEAGGMVSFVQNGARSGEGNVFVNNTIAFDRGRGRFGISIQGRAASATVERNIVVTGTGPALWVDRRSAEGLRSDGNVFWVLTQKPPFMVDGSPMPLPVWQRATRQDRRSMVGAPGFVAPTQNDYRLDYDAPALGMGAGCFDEGKEVAPPSKPRWWFLPSRRGG